MLNDIKARIRPVVPLFAACFALAGCSKEPPAAEPVDPVSSHQEESESDLFGAASINEFKESLRQAFVKKDYELYRKLHCWDKLNGPTKAALMGAVENKSLKLFTFVPASIEVEEMNEKELNLIRPDEWNLLPTHWVIVNGATPNQFKHWELGQQDGRYFLASRLK